MARKKNEVNDAIENVMSLIENEDENVTMLEDVEAELENKIIKDEKNETELTENETESAEDKPIIENNEPKSPEKVKKEPVRVNFSNRPPPILTIESGDEIESPEYKNDILWHEIQNAYRTKQILSGILSGIEKTAAEYNIAVVYYKGLRVAIPVNDMVTIKDTEVNKDRNLTAEETEVFKSKIVGAMLGAEVDFIVKGIDSKTRSIVASRLEAMVKKRQTFYTSGKVLVHEGRIVQARVIIVGERSIWVEAFGVECRITARNLSHEWFVDASEYYSVGDKILVRVNEINHESGGNITIKADVKSLTEDTSAENMKKCTAQGQYAGQVTDYFRGVYFMRLTIGVNAIAHTCRNMKNMPGKRDMVSFVITHFDDAKNIAMGKITRMIKFNYI